jgi:hypothetical protein
MIYKNLTNDVSFDRVIDSTKAFFESIDSFQALKDKKYTFTQDNFERIKNSVEFFKAQKRIIEIRSYTTWKPWSRVIGYTNGINIFVNSRKSTSLEPWEWVGNCAHETMHIIGYGHGSNRVTPPKLDSVPYFWGNYASEWAKSQFR